MCVGMLWQNEVFYNRRNVMIIDSVHFGRVAVVAVGAACVGTCLDLVVCQNFLRFR